jgi:hypothetical protein
MSAITTPGVREGACEDRIWRTSLALLDTSPMPHASTMPFAEGAVRDFLASAISQAVATTVYGAYASPLPESSHPVHTADLSRVARQQTPAAETNTDLSVVVERDAGGAIEQRDWCRRGNTASLAAWLV